MKKIRYILITLALLLVNSNTIYAELQCTEQAAIQMAKIVCNEYGTDYIGDSDLDFYVRITTTAVVLNNAYVKSGNTWYDKMMNLTSSNYGGYYTYRDASFDAACSAPAALKSQMLYMSALVMNGYYALPSNLRLQASEQLVRANGKVWDHINIPGRDAMYFGSVEINDPLSTKDIFGRDLSDNSYTYYRQLSRTLKQASYTKYTSSNVCSLTKQGATTEINYNITYDLEGGFWPNNTTNKPSSAKTDSVVTIANPEKIITITGDANGTGATIGSPLTLNQEFAGWTSSKNNGLDSVAMSGSSSNNLTSWDGTSTKNTYFKNLKSSTGNIKLIATWKNITKELPTVTKSGYTCKWNTKKDGTGTSYDSKERYTFVSGSSSGFTLYAQCTKGDEERETNETNYLIKYISEDSIDIPESQIKESNTNITLSTTTPKRNGYTFVEWNTKSDGSGVSYNPGDKYTKDNSITLYAIWSKNDINNNDNPQTGLAALIICPIMAIMLFIFATYYIKRMKENNIV